MATCSTCLYWITIPIGRITNYSRRLTHSRGNLNGCLRLGFFSNYAVLRFKTRISENVSRRESAIGGQYCDYLFARQVLSSNLPSKTSSESARMLRWTGSSTGACYIVLCFLRESFKSSSLPVILYCKYYPPDRVFRVCCRTLVPWNKGSSEAVFEWEKRKEKRGRIEQI